MKTVIRNSYTPKTGDYCETIVVDKESGDAYIFDCDGIFTPMPQPVDVEDILRRAAEYTDETVAPLEEKLDTIEEGAQVNVIETITQNGHPLTITDKTVNVTVPTKTSDLENDGSDGTDTYVESSTLDDYYTKSETDTQIGYETDAREIADAGLQEQIDAIVASSDVVDIVGTYAALQAYDTSKLHDNDIIKVLTDETRDDATTYYRWDADTSTWGYIGAEGPFYTKAESDALFTPMTRTINNKALSSDITLTAADVHALPDSTVIPTVNDATLTIQKNGTNVATFTANSASNQTANITVPVDTSDLNNDGDGQSPFATEDYVDTYGGKIDTIEVNGVEQQIVNKTVDITVPTKTSDLTNDGADGTSTYAETDDLGAAAFSNRYADLDGLPTIPTVNDATLTIQKNGTNVATFTANSATSQTANITVPVNTSDLTNDSGFITSSALSNYYTKSETYSQGEVNNLINSLSIPTKTSDLTNDSGFISEDDLYSEVCGAGTTITFQGAPNNAPLSDFKLKGETSQNGTPTPDAPVAVQTVTGENVVKISDGQGNEQSYTIDLGSIELCKIGTYQDYIYKSGGKWYVHKAVAKVVLNGTENWRSGGVTNTQYTDSITNYATSGNLPFSSSFAGVSNVTAAGAVPGDNTIAFINRNDIYRFYIKSNVASSVGAVKTWLSNNNLSVYYALATPTDTEITNATLIAQLEAILSQGYTYAGTNNITTVIAAGNEQGELEVCYTKTILHIATETSLGIVQIGSGLSITANGVLSVASAGSVDWDDVTNRPTNVSYWTNDAGYITSAAIPTNVSSFTNDAGYITSAAIPTNVSAFTNDAGYLTSSSLSNYYTKSETYNQSQVNSLINSINIPTKTSDLTNDGEDGTSTYVEADDLATVATSGSYNDLSNKPTIPTIVDMTGATSSTAGAHGYVPAPAAGDQNKFLQGDGTWATPADEIYTAGNGISIDANNEISVDTSVVATQTDLAGKQDTLTAGSNMDITNNVISAKVDSALSASSTNPVQNSVVKAALDGKADTSDLPTKTSDLTNDGADGTSTYVETSALGDTAFSNDYNDLDNLPTIPSYSDFTGATSSTAGAHGLVPAPAAGDEGKFLQGDGTWGTVVSGGLVEMAYGESNAWQKFIDAYNTNKIVYCRASSNSNPATGSQTRKAFMAYVNNATTPTSVEFQYVRSVSSKTSSQPVDQVFVYTLTNASGGTWSVASRNMAPKLAAGTNATVSYSNGTYTVGATVPTKTSDLTNDGSDGGSTYVEADQLATVAASGSYNDLTDKPTIPTVNDATLTIQKNGTNVQTFTANSSSNKTANIQVPNLQTSDTDPGEGSVLAADTFLGIYDIAPEDVDGARLVDGSVTSSKIDWSTITAGVISIGTMAAGRQERTVSIPTQANTDYVVLLTLAGAMTGGWTKISLSVASKTTSSFTMVNYNEVGYAVNNVAINYLVIPR